MVVDILAALAVLFWLMVYMFSPMMLGAPGASNDIANLRTLLIVLYYPCYIFLAYIILRWSFFGMAPWKFFLGAAVLISLACTYYLGAYLNLKRGILNSGYSIANSTVYWNAIKIDAVAVRFFAPRERRFSPSVNSHFSQA